MTLVRFSRVGGHPPPPDDEHLAVAPDGTFTAWRSIGGLSAGAFAGQLSEEELDRLRELVEGASAAGDLEILPRPDNAIESVDVDGAHALMGHHAQPEGAWGELLAALRDLLSRVGESPQSAVVLAVAPDGTSAELRHAGSEPLELHLPPERVRVVQWHEYVVVGDWSAPPQGEVAATVTAAPGWRYALPFDHGLEAGPDHPLGVFVDLALVRDGAPVPARLNDRLDP